MFNPWVGKISWRRKRLPTLVFWPGEFHGLYSPWGHKESDTTERLSLSLWSPPASSVHGILQARILEWVAIAFSRGSSRPSDRTWVSRPAGRRFAIIAVLALCQTSTRAASLNPRRNPVWKNDLRMGKLRPGLVQELGPILESCAVRPPQPLLDVYDSGAP